MSESNSAVLEAPVVTETHAEPTPKKARPKPSGKKATAAKAATKKKATGKANTAPKSKPMPDGKSVHASEPKREPVWNDRRVALVKAMRSLKADDALGARTADEIAKRMGTVDGIKMVERVDLVKVILDVYRTSELVHNGFAKSVKHEGERGLRYFLTKKGLETTFPRAK